MFRNSNLLFLLLKPHSLELYSPSTKEQSSLPLANPIIDNLEVLDIDKLYALIADWSKVRTYQNTDLVILLHPTVCFEKKLPDTDKLAWDTQTLQFLDSVPFEDVLSHLYHPLDGRQIVATNKTLVTAISHGFALHGYTTRLIVPCSVVGIENFDDPARLKEISSKLGTLAKDSFLLDPLPVNPKTTPANPQSPKAKSQLPLLIGVFGLLLAVLIIMLLLR